MKNFEKSLKKRRNPIRIRDEEYRQIVEESFKVKRNKQREWEAEQEIQDYINHDNNRK